MPLLSLNPSSAIHQSVAIDKNYSLPSEIVIRKNADGTISEGKDVYVFNCGSGNISCDHDGCNGR